MSLPGSRIVVNPYNFDRLAAHRTPGKAQPAEYSNGPDLPLNIGYYADDEAEELPEALSMYRRDPETRPRLRVGLEDDFGRLDDHWSVSEGMSTEVVDGQLMMTVHDTIAASISRTVRIDVDATPFVQVAVPKTAGKWSLQVDGEEPSFVFLQRDTDQTGTFTYDLREMAGWHGTVEFRLIFVAIYEERPTFLDHIRIVGVDSPMETASSFDTEWLPGRLPFDAEYAGGLRVNGHDAFYDRSIVVRSLEMEPTADAEEVVTLAGRFRGQPTWNPKLSVLTIRAPTYSYAVGFSRPPVDGTRLYASEVDFLLQEPSEVSEQGFWSADLPVAEGATPASRLGVVVAFAAGSDAAARAEARVGRMMLDGRWRDAGERQSRFWDEYLTGVPHPHDFTLRGVPTFGMTTDQIRREYYTAWVHLAANVLPPMPEIHFPYPQIANGKPSLWTYGAAGARPSAQWESILEMQFYAYVAPDTAWRAYQGLLSLVGEDGEMGGESLPSRKAQTGVVLYELTGDEASLRSAYPALKRHLLWERDHPRWICCGESPVIDFPNERDSAFVVSVLVDMRYAEQIADILGLADEAEFWKQQRSRFFQDYLRWLWPTTEDPVQYHFVGEEGCNYRGDCRGDDLNVAIGLHLESLSADHVAGLMNRFAASYDATAPFAGFADARYPNFSLASYGLLAHERPDGAAVLANAYLRDVVRAHMFAESYHPDGGSIRPVGVRPSSFAAMTVIDAVWMKNGYRMDLGWPHFVGLPGESGGLNGITMLGRTLNLTVPEAKHVVQVSGSLVNSSAECRRFPLATGVTIPLPRACVAGE